MKFGELPSPLERRRDYDDYDVEALAAISMWISVVFLLLQFLVFIPVTVVGLVLESKGWSAHARESVYFAVWVPIELGVFTYLAWRGRLAFKKHMEARSAATNDGNISKPSGSPFTEKRLMLWFGFAALAGIGHCIQNGIEIAALRYFLIVVEGFAVLFLSIFIIVRFLAMNTVKPVSIAFLILLGITLGLLLN